MSDTRIRVGLMGCGAVADYGHIPAILETGEFALHSIYDPNQEALARIQKKYGVPNACGAVPDFFASGIEAVSITSPAPCHRGNALAAARYRLPVLCEKPLAINRREASEMIAAMKEANASLYAAFCYRFSPCALKIRDLVRAKAIGEVRALRLIYNWDAHGKYTVDDNGQPAVQRRRQERMLEGGPLIDCGTHQIDLAHFWMESPVVSFSAHGAWVEGYEAPDHMWLHLDHANGAHTLVEISYSYHHTARNRRREFVYELIGTAGVIRYDREARSFRMEDTSGTSEFPFASEKSFTGLYAEWARALRAGASGLLASAEDGMRVVEIAQTATEQAMKGRGTGERPPIGMT